MNWHTTHTVLHTEASLGWGGQEMRILREIVGLSQRGWNMMLACDPESGLFLHALKYNIPLIPLKFNYLDSWQIIKQLRAALREYDVGIIHTHSSVDAWLGGIAARMSRRCVIRTRHLSTPIKGGWNAKLLYDHLADAVICTSQNAVDQLRLHLPNKNLVECIATGIDEVVLDHAMRDVSAARKELGLHEGDVAIGTACVLRSWKGIEEFLASANKLHHIPHVRFFIFGAGPGLEHYQKLAKEQFPQAHVTFTGHLDPVSRALAAMDIVCLLSTAHEGISQATLQAAYLSKPLVTTNIGGLPQVCIDQQTGILVPPKDSQAVTKALSTLIENHAFRDRLGKKGRQLVQNSFTMSKSLDAIENVLHRAARVHKA